MKDLYSFHTNEEDLDKYYEKVEEAYTKIFNDLGIGDKTLKTYASGGTFSKYSHEYQTLLENGEDTIYVCEKCNIAVNKEIISEQSDCPVCGNKELVEKTASETANIFKLKTKYSEPFGVTYKDADGKENPVIMGCYGIGISRMMGIVAELCHDDKGLSWPDSIAPFGVHLISLYGQDEEVNKKIDEVSQNAYNTLEKLGIEVLFDDRRDKSPGEKFAESDLVGIPLRMVVSQKTGDKIEIKKRNGKEVTLVDFSELKQYVKSE